MIRALIATLAVAAALGVGQDEVASIRQGRIRTDIEDLVAEARTLPAEFSADALIRIATSPAVPDRAARRDLLQTAFLRAYTAQEPYRRIAGTLRQDTRQTADVRAGETGLT